MMILGIILIIIGVGILIKGILRNNLYKELKSDKKKEYIKTTGTVICDAYPINEAANLNKGITPIVSYKVNGEEYEAQNRILETSGELPVGTKVIVWYKKDNPKEAILGTSLNDNFFEKNIGVFIIAIGILFIIGCT